jgi:hypothetical protein
MRLVFGSLDDSATAHSGALLRTNVGLPKGMFPLWDSSVEALYNRPTDGPRTGELAMFSGPGASTDGYQRISRTLTVPRTEAPPRLSFWTSYDIAPESHAFFVEARPVGTDDWTTLPDDLGHTSPREGLYLPCAYDVPQLGHYMTPTWGSLDWGCQPRGTTGAWNAATGRSDGWEPWSIDLSAYAGREIEIAITYLSLYERAAGVMLDDLTLPNDKHTSFENDLAGWKVGSAPSPNPQGGSQFHQARADDYPMGAVITTDRTVTFGFGLEGISSTAVKNQVVGKAIAHLLGGRRGANRIFLPAARTP